MASRLTRKESQARTRSQLLEAAGRVFADRGLERATVDQVAGEAGYTKGAFYANFSSKEEIFLAMLDERFATRLEEIDRVLDSGATVTEQARMAGQEFNDHLAGNPEWSRLFFEFAVQALRDERFRAELVAAMTYAMADGFALARLLEPESVPEDMFGSMLEVFFTGLEAMRPISL